MKKKVLALWLLMLGLVSMTDMWWAYAQTPSQRYEEAIATATDETSSSVLFSDAEEWIWADVFNKQVVTLIWFVINIFIVVWIAIAFVWWYKIMFSSKEDATKEWLTQVAFGVLWIVIMVSAKFLANSLVWGWWILSSTIRTDGSPNWIILAQNLYDKILFPFIRIVLYLVVWVLFFMMVAKVVSFVTSTDDTAKKKAWWTIIWTVVWILIIMWAKQIVEAVMWRQERVLNKNATRIDGQTPESVLEFGSIPLISQIINRVMWLTMFIILVLIIIQAYKMFSKPDDPKNRESLKKTIIYILIWVLVIWASYAISSVLVINRL